MQVHRNNYTVNSTPVFEVLTEKEIESIYFSALRVLYETGVRVYEKEGVELAHAGGAIVEDVAEVPAAAAALAKIPYGVSCTMAALMRARASARPAKIGRMPLLSSTVISATPTRMLKNTTAGTRLLDSE